MLRFYKGGPRAVKGAFFWMVPSVMFGTGGKRIRISDYGCFVARHAGAEIPPDTYCGADKDFSQEAYVHVNGRKKGHNMTALLPIEE